MAQGLKEYIGDSVYANFDGWHIVLTTENGYPDDPRNTIALEPSVLAALNRYAAWIKEMAEDELLQRKEVTPP